MEGKRVRRRDLKKGRSLSGYRRDLDGTGRDTDKDRAKTQGGRAAQAYRCLDPTLHDPTQRYGGGIG